MARKICKTPSCGRVASHGVALFGKRKLMTVVEEVCVVCAETLAQLPAAAAELMMEDAA